MPAAIAAVVLRHDGPPVPSQPHIAMTVAMLRDAGVVVDDRPARPRGRWRLARSEAATWVVEPDLSNAAPFLAAALVTGGRVTIPGWPQRTTQPGDQLRHLLAAMGAACVLHDGGLTVHGLGRVYGLDADLHDVGELAPVLAAVAALAEGPSHLRGIAHLRGHETDRLAALARELARLGGDVTELPDGLRHPPGSAPRRPLPHLRRPPPGHRRAPCSASSCRASRCEDVATTAKTLPGFAASWAAMLGGEAGWSPDA